MHEATNGNLNKSPLTKPKSGGGTVKGGGKPRLEGTLGTKFPAYSIHSGNTPGCLEEFAKLAERRGRQYGSQKL